MSATDDQKAYSRGYAAGRRRVKSDRIDEQRYRERQAFLDKAFLAALPALINGQTWKAGDKEYSSVAGRVEMAWKFAREALKQRTGP